MSFSPRVEQRHAKVTKIIHVARDQREVIFQSSRGNLSICSIERQAKTLALCFQFAPALRNGFGDRQDTACKPFLDFHLEPLLQFSAPLASVEQLAPLANF